MTADRQLAARAMELAELERALMAIKPVGSIDGHDVVRRESVRDIVQQRALAAQRAAPKDEPKVVAWMFDRRYGSGLSFVKPDSYADEDGNMVHPEALVLNSESDAAIVAAAQRAEQAPPRSELQKMAADLLKLVVPTRALLNAVDDEEMSGKREFVLGTSIAEVRQLRAILEMTAAEQAQGAEPVAWRHRHRADPEYGPAPWTYGEHIKYPADGVEQEPLYAHAQPQAAPNWTQAYEQERAKFQAETLRTSEQAILLQRWIDRGLCMHHTAESAFWSARCESCKLMEETKALLLKPINSKEPK